ncbi:MAG: HAMP domain-containing histidine kinase [Bacteroidales bacterium]|jgi:signal transduction histidine kinase|nr:HAMP domain-containing histidine kinase [Bacteroidales bacterium]
MFLDTRHLFEFSVYSWAVLVAFFATGYVLYLLSGTYLRKHPLRILGFGFLYSIIIALSVYFYEGQHEKQNMILLSKEILNKRDTVFENKIAVLKNDFALSTLDSGSNTIRTPLLQNNSALSTPAQVQPNLDTQPAPARLDPASYYTTLQNIDNTYQYYFTGCKKGEKLLFKDSIENCSEYFHRKIKDDGIATDVKGLYAMRGDILHYSYLLHLCNDTVDIYVEMGKARDIYLPPEYSYALFGGYNIWFHRGDFLYSYNRKYEMADTALFRINRGYVHYIIPIGDGRTSGEQALVITVPKPRWYFVVYNFSFYFLSFFFLFFICNLFKKSESYLKTSYAKRLRNTILIVVVTVFVVFGSIAFFFLQEWKSKEAEADLKEKMMTVLIGMETKYMNVSAAAADTLESAWSEDIDAYSTLTLSTVKLYGVDGIMLFGQDTISEETYQALYANQRHLVFTENDNMLSAYAPFRNMYNEIFGYLQVSSITDVKAWNIEMGNFVSMYITLIFLLGVLTFLIAYLLTRYLTEPLRKISEHLAGTRLSKTVSKLILKRGKFEDEISELVTQYNTLISELEKRDKMLRESAFSEMARQVAHEIKNPLTPIKLKIQQLLRAYEDKKPDFEQRLKNFAGVAIDQIELLTNIANKFSQFSSWLQPQDGKMSDDWLWQKPNMETGDVNEEVKKAVSLFSEKVKITLLAADEAVTAVFDKKFLAQILTNIISNALQAIDGKENGEIIISFKDEFADGKEYCCIAVSDNGTGIPVEDIQNIFEWHFTTKSSGSGMGLPISKILAESMNGFIRAESTAGAGSVFFVHLQKS